MAWGIVRSLAEWSNAPGRPGWDTLSRRCMPWGLDRSLTEWRNAPGRPGWDTLSQRCMAWGIDRSLTDRVTPGIGMDGTHSHNDVSWGIDRSLTKWRNTTGRPGWEIGGNTTCDPLPPWFYLESCRFLLRFVPWSGPWSQICSVGPGTVWILEKSISDIRCGRTNASIW
jgi:hypothetical protein